MRILILLAIGLLLYVIISNLLRKSQSSSPKSLNSQQMVRCEHCGLHILEQEAIQDGEQYFCSEEHHQAKS